MLDLRDINKLQIDSYITIAAINSPNIYNCPKIRKQSQWQSQLQ